MNKIETTRISSEELARRQYVETLRFQEERNSILSMSDDQYRQYLELKFGKGRWASREIELLLSAKKDQEAFREQFRLTNNKEVLDPLGQDFNGYLGKLGILKTSPGPDL